MWKKVFFILQALQILKPEAVILNYSNKYWKEYIGKYELHEWHMATSYSVCITFIQPNLKELTPKAQNLLWCNSQFSGTQFSWEIHEFMPRKRMFDSKTSFYLLKPHLTRLRIYAEKTWQAQCCRYWGLIQFMQVLNHTEKWTSMKDNSNSSWLCVAFDENTLKQCMCYWHCFPSFIADFLLFARTDHSSS